MASRAATGEKLWIARHLPGPDAGKLRTKGLVEAGVDLDRVEMLGQIFQRMKAAGLQSGINDAVPV